MSVSVRIPTILRTYTGGESEVTAEGDTLAEVLDDLDANYSGIKGRILDEAGELRRFVNVYVGNDDVRFLDEPGDAHARRHPDLGDPGGRRGLSAPAHRSPGQPAQRTSTATRAALPRSSILTGRRRRRRGRAARASVRVVLRQEPALDAAADLASPVVCRRGTARRRAGCGSAYRAAQTLPVLG